jgi:hypothetical protein
LWAATIGVADDQVPVEVPSAVAPAVEESNHLEAWYWGFNLGSGLSYYGNSQVRALIDSYSQTTLHIPFYADLRFLWPRTGHHTAWGASLSSYSDMHTIFLDHFSATSTVLSFSVDHFFDSVIGDGFFVRGEAGVAQTNITSYALFSTTPGSSDSVTGLALRAGAGYSIRLSNETRLPLQIQAQYVTAAYYGGILTGIFSFGMLF